MINRIENKFIDKLIELKHTEDNKFTFTPFKLDKSHLSVHFKVGLNEAEDMIYKYLKCKKHLKVNISLAHTTFRDLGILETLDGSLSLNLSEVETIGKLSRVKGVFEMASHNLTSLGRLSECKSLMVYGTPLEDLGKLNSLSGNLNLSGTNLKTLGALTTVSGNVTLKDNNKLDKLGSLIFVGGNLKVKGGILTSLHDLLEICGNLDIRSTSGLDNFGSLMFLGGMVFTLKSKVPMLDETDLKTVNLRPIGRVYGGIIKPLLLVSVPRMGELRDFHIVVEVDE